MVFLNDYHKVNPIDQWVKILVTVTGFAHSYSDNIISKSSENPELVAPNFGDEIKYLSEIELGTMVKEFIF